MTDSAIDIFEHAGVTVKIFRDFDEEDANPRMDDGNLGVMFCDYPGYTLGDENAPDPRKAVMDPEDRFEVAVVKWLKERHGARVVIPLFVYEHSGITMFAGGRLDTGADDFSRTNRYAFDAQGWDTSSVGVIFDTAESRQACGLAEDVTDDEIEIEHQLREEVRYYDAYLKGMVFGYVIENENGDFLDSCWGFLDPDFPSATSYVEQSAREAAEVEAEAIKREALEAYRWVCADVVTR